MKVSPGGLFRIMQVLGQNTNGAHNHMANIKVFGSLNNALDYEIKLLAEHLVQRLVFAWLGNTVPRQEQLNVGAIKHWGEHPQSQSVS